MKHQENNQGYILLGALILVTLSAVIIVSSLNVSSSTTRSVKATKDRSTEYYKAEETLGTAASWMRQNSTKLVLAFSRANFYTNFDKTTPTNGSNDTGTYAVPTKVKIRGTTKSVILADDSEFMTSEFPSTVDAANGQAFDAKAVFPTADYGDAHVRVTLVDAIPIDAAKDYGDVDTGSAPPDTDFAPVFRVDSLKENDRGGYLYGYITGSLAYNFGVGFYGKNVVDFRQECDSYISNNGAYNAATKRANCPVGSNGTMQIHQNEEVYGVVKTNGGINKSSPYGGKVCSDFSAGCPNAGETCEGLACNVPPLPTYSTWTTYCPTNQGNLTIAANSTLLVPGNNANQKCWATVKVNAGKTLTLRTTNYSYFIDTFDIANNAVVNFSPNPATGTINLYVKKFVGDKFNGNQVFNINNKPYQLRIHYLGTDDLTMNGTADMSAFLVAPYAAVNVQGTFTYNGGIKALSLYATGSGKLHYDESGDITTLSDVTFKLRNVHERYR